MRFMKSDGKKITTKKTLAINERRVKAFMAEQGLTQVRLAGVIGMSVANLNRLLKNHRNAHRHIDKIADALGVSTRRILSDGPSSTTSSQGSVSPPALAASSQE